MRVPLLICFSFLFLTLSQAQPLPNTNVMLFDMDQKSDSTFSFKNPKFLTDFNKDGYNNQPYFMADDELYLTIQPKGDTSQTDIYSLDLKRKTITQVTNTVESEYSPTFIPPSRISEDFEFSCIRVEMDGTQRLWKFPLNRNNNGKPVFNELTGIGYHYWVDYRDVVLFIVGTPHKLYVADARDASTYFVTSNIGRCFQEMPDGTIAFVEKVSEGSWLLKKLDTRTYRTTLITATMNNNEDFVVLGDGTIIMAQGTKLYKFNQRRDITWLEIADFVFYGMRKITRLAVNDSESKIAIVVTE